VRLAVAEACATEASTSVERGVAAYRFDLASNLAHLHETYERNIQSLDGIYSPIASATPSVKDYIRWLTSKVDCLREVFASVNENFSLSDRRRACWRWLEVLTPSTSSHYEQFLLIAEQISSQMRGMSEGLPGFLPGAGGVRRVINRLLLRLT
jgi:hypothetical protein